MRPVHRCLLIAALLLPLAGCQTAAPQAAAPSTPVTTVSGVVLNVPRAGLYVSGQPGAGDWMRLPALGIGTVINLRPQAEMAGRDEGAEVRAAGLRYIEIPVANAEAITRENARKLHEAIGSAKGSPVLVHCASANRAGGLLALAMVTEHGMPPEQALAFGRKAGMKSTEAQVRKVLELPPMP